MEASYTFDFNSDYYLGSDPVFTLHIKQPFICRVADPDGRKIRIVNMGLVKG
jgi:hypothetical protein